MRKLFLTIIGMVSLSPVCWAEDVFIKNRLLDVNIVDGINIITTGASDLAVGTGTSSSFNVYTTSPTSGINFNRTQFQSTRPDGTTNYITLHPTSISLSTLTVTNLAVTTITWADGTTSTTTGGGGGGGSGDITAVNTTAPLTGGAASGAVTLDIDRSSFTLQGPVVSSITLAAMYGSPTLVGTNFTSLPGAQVGSGVPAANIASGSLGSSVIASSITLASMYGAPTLVGTNFTSLPGAQVGSGVPAANIASGSLGSSVIASSITLASMYGAPTLTGTNITGIPGSNLTGTVPTSVLPSSVTYTISTQTISGFKTFSSSSGTLFNNQVTVQSSMTVSGELSVAGGASAITSTQPVISIAAGGDTDTLQVFTTSVAVNTDLYATTLHGDGSLLTGISGTFNGGTVANYTTFSSSVNVTGLLTGTTITASKAVGIGSLADTPTKELVISNNQTGAIEMTTLSPTVTTRWTHIQNSTVAQFGTVTNTRLGLTSGSGVVEGLTLSSMSMVGIGNTLPSYRLQVSSAAGTAGVVMAVSTGTVDLFTVAGTSVQVTAVPLRVSQIIYDNGTVQVSSPSSSGAADGTGNWTASGNNSYQNTGKVGIGTTSPISPFEVRQSSWTAGVIQSPAILMKTVGTLYNPEDIVAGFYSLTIDTGSIDNQNNTGHIIGTFSRSSDTANGHSDMFATESRADGYGEGSYYGVLAFAAGHHTAVTTATTVGLAIDAKSTLMDEVTPSTWGTNIGIQIRTFSGGLSTSTWVFYNAVTTAPFYNRGNMGIGSFASAPTTDLLLLADSGANPSMSIQGLSPGSILRMGFVSASSAAYVGTTSGQRMGIYAGNAERVSVSSNSNVGIGNTTPTYRLHVATGAGTTGTIFAVSSGTVDLFSVIGTSVNLKVPLVFPDGTVQTTAGGAASQWTTNGSSIGYTGGWVGIGTTNPDAPLKVTGKNASLQMALFDGGADDNNPDLITIRHNGTSYGTLGITGANNNYWIGSSTGDMFVGVVSTNNAVIIGPQNTGSAMPLISRVVGTEPRVGVGLSYPSYLLHVSSAAGESRTLFAVSTGAVNLFSVLGTSVNLKVPLVFPDGSVQVTADTGPGTGGGGDSLGTHVATKTLDMGNFAISNATDIVSSRYMFLNTTGTIANATNINAIGVMNTSVTINNNQIVAQSTAVTVSANLSTTGTFVAAGAITGASFSGNGANLTSLTGSQVGSGVPAANIASGSLGSSVIASSITLAAMYGAPTLVGTNFTSLPGAQVGSGVPAANIAAGSLGASVLASSITLASMYGAPTLTGTNFTGIPQSGVTSLTTDLGNRVLKAGDTMSGQLTVQSSVTISGNGTIGFGTSTGTIAVTGNNNAIGLMSSSVTLNNNQLILQSTMVTANQNFRSSGTITATNVNPSPFFVVHLSSDSLAAGCTIWMGDAPSNSAITITSVKARTYSVAASSVNYSLQEKTDQSANGSQIFTGTYSTGTWSNGSPITSFNDASIAAGSSIYFVTKDAGATAGTPRHLTVTVYYKYDSP